jgi:poly-gamma-glutamate synthase PgsB/CapB
MSDKLSDKQIMALLQLNLSKDWIKIKGGLLQRLGHDFSHWQVNTEQLEGIDQHNWLPIQLVQFLLQQVNTWIAQINTQQQVFNQFSQQFRKADSMDEARHFLVEISATLGYSKASQRKIRRGKAPWLDENAIYDGHIKKLAGKEQDISHTLARLGDILPHLLQQADADSLTPIWQLLSLHENLQQALHYQGNIHIRIQAFSCLSKSLTRLARLPVKVEHRVPANVVQYIYRTCLDEGLNIWLRSEAVQLVSQFNPEQFFAIIDKLFVAQPAKDIYLRGRVAKLLCHFDHGQSDPSEMDKMLAVIAADPSDYVRQILVKYAIKLTSAQCMNLLVNSLKHDTCAQVRAQAYLTLAQSLKLDNDLLEQVLQLQIAGLQEQHDFALRTLLHTLPGCAAQLLNIDYIAQLQEQLKVMQQSQSKTAIKRWLANTREYLWAVHHPLLPEPIKQQLQQLPLHQQMTFRAQPGCDHADLQRYLASIGRERFGFDIQQKGNKIKVRAGFKFGFRLWRLLHEMRTPATDKRENHNHLKGRLYFGLSHTATQRMAEMSATRVPGEPFFIDEEQGWRDYLPLLDQVLSSLDQGWPTQAVKIYSSEGITSILPPKGLLARLYARTVIQFRFARLAQLRNWQEPSNHGPAEYVLQLRKLGFTISIEAYLDEQGNVALVESQARRFFPVIALPFAIPSLGDMQNYFYSVYQNTLGQLLAFTGLATLGYLGAHITKLSQMRFARSKIPLVVGGWGTRGKSGTERLKAALFNAMGLSVVSKTTGCEAMFMYGPANRPMKEMFLFRPYDKASIWEQVFLTQITAKLGADVFLWECMALTPRYIDIIQNQWMRDDISTITNCYPDHEDLQGPAGIEIPIVMQRFVPKNSVLIASEESMLPLLEDAARQKNSQLMSVSWLESGLLTDDVVSRFPYEEHPNNIALVARMAKVLDIEEDFALKEMADNVVADLGVLKIYPLSEVAHRRLVFINGMSANERLGAMGNWHRTGLAKQNRQQQPDKWLAIVVNNRADRIARSKVFAAMLVNDTQADSYFFIGDNLNGFAMYLLAAWQRYAFNLDLSSVEKLQAQAQKFRIATTEQQVLQRLQACISGLSFDHSALLQSVPLTLNPESVANWQPPGVDINLTKQPLSQQPLSQQQFSQQQSVQAIVQQFRRDAKQYLEFKTFTEQFDANTAQPMSDWLFACFKSRWTVLEDYYASGNQTINSLVAHSPPGLLCNIIGVQNIKGTGLDFIYRWQSWQQVYQYCDVLLNSRDEICIGEAAKALTTWEEFGLLDQQKVCQTLAIVKHRSHAQTEQIQAQLELIQQRMDQQLSAIGQLLHGSKSQSKIWSLILNALEAFLDAGDAITRRKTADKIYRAIVDNLISYDKASLELAKLTQAQKGGWLEARVKRLLERTR